MIAQLRGTLAMIAEDHAVIDVGGVGYQVFCSTSTLSKMPPVGDPVTVAVETVVREDRIHLFGFLSALERDWFRRLCSIQGVGQKVALAIQSSMNADALVHAIAAGDAAAFKPVSGVGPKLAGRIIGELKDKIGGMDFALAPQSTGAEASASVAGSAAQDAMSALVNLGYRRADALRAVSTVVTQLGDAEAAGVQAIIRGALKELSA
ncbi:Holliday junction branch migration protein RuvA [Alphaproteobacteria bacterium HT1-32]|nr:Holliday junction branch migration protein RuvA [Alphaproteobacteria bacterium HT1-32]